MRDEDFFIGDEVEIRASNSQWNGRRGRITEITGFDILVRIGTYSLLFSPSELKLIVSPERRSKWWKYTK